MVFNRAGWVKMQLMLLYLRDLTTHWSKVSGNAFVQTLSRGFEHSRISLSLSFSLV